jgi:DNA-binding Lrp family transcriptional regulator
VNTAIVHIDCATDSIPEVAEALAALEGVSEVYSVAGGVDLIAIVRVPHFDDIAEVIPGVINSETFVAFRAYSKHDLEDAFAIGLPDAD